MHVDCPTAGLGVPSMVPDFFWVIRVQPMVPGRSSFLGGARHGYVQPLPGSPFSLRAFGNLTVFSVTQPPFFLFSPHDFDLDFDCYPYLALFLKRFLQFPLPHAALHRRVPRLCNVDCRNGVPLMQGRK